MQRRPTVRLLLCLFPLVAALFAGSPASLANTPKGSSATPKKILFLGDSLTAGYGVAKTESFPALIDKLLDEKGLAHVQVINAGISGSTTASGQSRLKWYLRAPDKPTHLVLALGANDGLRGQNLDAAKDNLLKTIQLAQSFQIKVLVAGMMIPPNYGPQYTKTFQKMFPSVAKETGSTLIPFLLDGVAADPKLNLPDGIHPNPEGYKIVAQTVMKHLIPLLK